MSDYIVRTLTDGLADDRMVSEDHPHTAEALFSSTVDLYRRSDNSVEVTVQLILPSGEVEYEICIPL